MLKCRNMQRMTSWQRHNKKLIGSKAQKKRVKKTEGKLRIDNGIKEKIKDKRENKIQTIVVKNNDTNKRRIIVNDKKCCTQTAYVGSLVTMLVLHAPPRLHLCPLTKSSI